MFQRKLIAVLGLIAFLAVSAGVSQASKSRVEGMALLSPALSQFTDDYVNIYYFPTSVVRQNNLVLAELGNNPGGSSDGYFIPGYGFVQTNDQSFTVIRNFPKFGAIAFDMKQSALNSLNSDIGSSLNAEQLDVIWGKAFTKIDLAVRLDITNSKYENLDSPADGTPTTTELHGWGGFSPFFSYSPDNLIGGGVELNTFGITPAIAIHMANDNRFEGALTYRKYTMDYSTITGVGPAEKFEDTGNASLALAARMIYNKGDKSVWYPAAWYVSDDLGYKTTNTGLTPAAAEVDETYRSYGAGISNNMRVNDNNLLLWGVAAWQEKHTYERNDANTGGSPGDEKRVEESQTTLPIVFAAIETDATKWLKVRIGANRAMLNAKSEFTTFDDPTLTPPASTGTTKTTWNDFNFSLGTGIKWNNLDIDMTLNEKFPLSGGYILSGDSSTPFTRASATYHF